MKTMSQVQQEIDNEKAKLEGDRAKNSKMMGLTSRIVGIILILISAFFLIGMTKATLHPQPDTIAEIEASMAGEEVQSSSDTASKVIKYILFSVPGIVGICFIAIPSKSKK